MLPNIFKSADMKTGLETPQIVTNWEFQTDPYWWEDWIEFRLRRKYYDFPASYSDGTALLSEVFSNNPSVNYADLTVDPDIYSYESMFLRHYTHHDCGSMISSNILWSVKRQFSSLLGVARDDITTNTFWFAGIDWDGNRIIVRYDADNLIALGHEYGCFDRKLNLTGILQTNEFVVGVGQANAFGADPYTLPICTNQRRILLDVSSADIITSSEIVHEYTFDKDLSPGAIIGGYFGVSSGGDIHNFILDTSNHKVIRYVDGALPWKAVIDYSSLTMAEDINDISYSVTDDVIVLSYHTKVVFLDPALAAWVDQDILQFFGMPYYIANGSLLAQRMGGICNLGFLEQESGIFYHSIPGAVYPSSASRMYRMDWYDNDLNCNGLFHCDESVGAPAVVDYSGFSGNAVNNGCTEEQLGRFGICRTRSYYSPGPATNIQATLQAQGGFMNPTTGAIEVQYKAPNEAYWNTVGPLMMWRYTGNFGAGTDYVDLNIDSGIIYASYISGGGIPTIASSPVPSPDDKWHHIAVVWGAAPNNLELYFDGTLLDSQALGGLPFITVPGFEDIILAGSSAPIGATCAGYYTEIRLSTQAMSPGSYYMVWNPTFKLHEWSGRDYALTSFEFRDQLFKDFMPEITKEDDTNLVHWFPLHTLSDGEVLHRSGDLSDGGQLRSLLRMTGLFIDRCVDLRDRILADQDIDTVSYSHIGDLSQLMGYANLKIVYDPFTAIELNMERFRQILKALIHIWKRKGTLNGMKLFCKLYHMAVQFEMVYFRKYWDSVVDPTRADIYLDTMRMDTSGYYEGIGVLKVRSYYMDYVQDQNSNGVTGAAGTSTFDSAGAAWLTEVRENDLLLIQDLSDPGANGEYLITSIPINTQVVVDHTWTVAEGGLANLSFKIWRYIPEVDPMAQFILDSLALLKPLNINLEYQ